MTLIQDPTTTIQQFLKIDELKNQLGLKDDLIDEKGNLSRELDELYKKGNISDSVIKTVNKTVNILYFLKKL